MKKKFNAAITYNVDSAHPDIECIKNPSEALTFDDVYTMDCDYFDNEEQMINFIKQDLKLVAGGGYNTEHIHNIKFNIQRV